MPGHAMLAILQNRTSSTVRPLQAAPSLGHLPMMTADAGRIPQLSPAVLSKEPSPLAPESRHWPSDCDSDNPVPALSGDLGARLPRRSALPQAVSSSHSTYWHLPCLPCRPQQKGSRLRHNGSACRHAWLGSFFFL